MTQNRVMGGLETDIKGEKGSGDAQRGTRQQAAPLPFLVYNNNNSLENSLKSIAEAQEITDKYRVSNVRKTKFKICENVTELISKAGIEKCLFVTMTFPDKPDLKTASKRFDSANKNALTHEILKGFRVMEPHADKAPHYHLILVVKNDVRSGFDF